MALPIRPPLAKNSTRATVPSQSEALARKAELSPELRALVERRIQAEKARAEASAAPPPQKPAAA